MFGFPLKEFMMLVFGFGFLIFVHELGHFMIAKWVGIRCPQFAIGFGHAIVSWRKGIGFKRGSTEPAYESKTLAELKKRGIKPGAKGPHLGTARYDDIEVPEEHELEYTGNQMFAVADEMGLGETEYRLNWLPLGGYVKMLGQEDMDPNAQSDDPRAYNNKPIWARACVISAGVVMNIIFGALFLMAAFMMGTDFPTATVGAVVPGMPAASTYAEGHEGDPRYLGLQRGDTIEKINNKEPEDFKEVQIGVALGSSKKPVTLEVSRLGFDENLKFKFLPMRARDGERLLSAGFEPGYSLDIVQAVKDTEFAEWAKGKSNLRITAIDGEAVDNFAKYMHAVRESEGQPLKLTVTDLVSSETTTLISPVEPTLSPDPNGLNSLAGLLPVIEARVVVQDTPAAEAGMKDGDIIKLLGDLEWPASYNDVVTEVVKANGKAIRIVVLRDGETVDLGTVEPDDNKLGIVPLPLMDRAVVGRVVEGSPAAALGEAEGLLPGSIITRINDQPIANWSELQRTLAGLDRDADGTATATITYTLPIKDSPTETAKITLDDDNFEALAAASWRPGETDFFLDRDMRTLKADNIGHAFLIGVDKSKDFILQTYITLLRLIQGDVKIHNLRGPVGIVDVGTQTAKLGLPYLLFFLGLISINLAVINFLPIPIVDGGHMVFLIIEKIKGSPPSPQVQAASLYVGLCLIGFVFIATLFYDVTRLIGL